MIKTKDENVGVVDPRVDEYINKLLETAEGYHLNGPSKKILNYIVYLLLNKKFRHLLQSFRLSLCMPVDGLKNEEEQDLWETKFREVVDKYHKGEVIDIGVRHLIQKVEKDLGRSLIDIKPKHHAIVVNICWDATNKTRQYIFQYLNLRNTKNFVYWQTIIEELLLFNSPVEIIIFLSKWSKVFGTQSIRFEQGNNRIKMTILLYPDTTIKDVEQLIESKRTRISEEINKINGNVRKNESKTSDIKRDYFIYRTYMNHKINRKRDDNIYSNITKADAVKSKAEESVNVKEAKEAKYLETNSIRKIVDRMNKRIKNAFPNSPTELDMFLGITAPKRRT